MEKFELILGTALALGSAGCTMESGLHNVDPVEDTGELWVDPNTPRPSGSLAALFQTVCDPFDASACPIDLDPESESYGEADQRCVESSGRSVTLFEEELIKSANAYLETLNAIEKLSVVDDILEGDIGPVTVVGVATEIYDETWKSPEECGDNSELEVPLHANYQLWVKFGDHHNTLKDTTAVNSLEFDPDMMCSTNLFEDAVHSTRIIQNGLPTSHIVDTVRPEAVRFEDCYSDSPLLTVNESSYYLSEGAQYNASPAFTALDESATDIELLTDEIVDQTEPDGTHWGYVVYE